MKIIPFLRIASFSVLALLASISAIASDSYGEPFEGWGFVKEDWQLVCDNTLTCRAAGYSEDGAEWRGSILMTVVAGEKIPSTEVLLNYWDMSEQVITQIEAQDDPVELWLNDKLYGEVKGSKLTKAQTMQLINNAKKSTKIVFKIGDYQWQIPDTGLAAILLKLDEVQGRVGTPLALVSRNNTNRQQPKPAKAIPKIYAAMTYPIAEYASEEVKLSDKQKFYQQLSERYNRKWQDKMSAWVMPTLNDDDRDSCGILTANSSWVSDDEKLWQFIPIDKDHTLARYLCWRAAYNEGVGYWLIDNERPTKPKLITISGSGYSEGEISAAHKGRGLGDCWSVKNWIWDGKAFAVSNEFTTGMCRGTQAGGAWSLPTYVSAVINP